MDIKEIKICLEKEENQKYSQYMVYINKNTDPTFSFGEAPEKSVLNLLRRTLANAEFWERMAIELNEKKCSVDYHE